MLGHNDAEKDKKNCVIVNEKIYIFNILMKSQLFRNKNNFFYFFSKKNTEHRLFRIVQIENKT